jgi:hypothetical protein
MIAEHHKELSKKYLLFLIAAVCALALLPALPRGPKPNAQNIFAKQAPFPVSEKQLPFILHAPPLPTVPVDDPIARHRELVRWNQTETP